MSNNSKSNVAYLQGTCTAFGIHIMCMTQSVLLEWGKSFVKPEALTLCLQRSGQMYIPRPVSPVETYI